MISKIFKSHIPSVNYFFASGLQAPFIGGKYMTNIPAQIAELDNEVANGHPHIYIDPKECEFDSDALTPMELIRQKAYDEAYAQAAKDLAAAGSMSDKVSESVQGPAAASFANSSTIMQGAANSVDTGVSVSEPSGTGVAAALAAMTGKRK